MIKIKKPFLFILLTIILNLSIIQYAHAECLINVGEADLNYRYSGAVIKTNDTTLSSWILSCPGWYLESTQSNSYCFNECIQGGYYILQKLVWTEYGYENKLAITNLGIAAGNMMTYYGYTLIASNRLISMNFSCP